MVIADKKFLSLRRVWVWSGILAIMQFFTVAYGLFVNQDAFGGVMIMTTLMLLQVTLLSLLTDLEIHVPGRTCDVKTKKTKPSHDNDDKTPL